MTDALARIEARNLVKNVDDLARVSKLLADSGYFADARDAAQCGVKVLAGLEMGIGPFSSMAGIHVIKGKPSIGAGLMAAAVKRSGKYNYRVVVHTHTECSIVFYEHGEECGTSTFTVDDARAAGLMNSDNWRKAPRNMLFARAMSNGVRWYAPDVFDASTYVPEELGADVDDEGNLVRVPTNPVVTVQPTAPAMPERVKLAEVIADAEILPAKPAVEPDAETPITPGQIATIMNIFGIAGINPRTTAGKEHAADLLSHVLDRPIVTMRGMTSVEAGAFIAAFTMDDGSIDETEVRGIVMEVLNINV